MKELTMFYFPECPYCQRAFRYHEELFQQHPEYRQVPLRLIDENRQQALAEQYDYWHVPTYYLGDEKLGEGVKDMSVVAEAFRRAFEAE